ncbi:MAG: RecQ family ATP-dependent DNA helicase [Candidatus Dormibacter sp.]|uniref:RecQ family ATP-dependent DNA helicase n=1 Tax=Candidatus Dormibacter sp. TaxID=2973982 RepID=UPI003D9B3155
MALSEPLQALQEVFQLQSFRAGQREVVEAQLSGRDVLSVAPTGAGKSVSYWVPALTAPGLTLVVSPLIALMKDQVDRLRQLGVAAGYINSSLDRPTQVLQLELAEAGEVKLLYVAPERFSAKGFVGRLNRIGLRRAVVDEAHCISSWGHDFREDYRQLGAAIAACGRPPIAAFTATATPQVRADIVASLDLRDPEVFVTGFNRPNLRLSARQCRGERGKQEALLATLDPGSGRALVYAGRRADSEQLAELITARGLPAAAYHAGLADRDRRSVQERFAAGTLRVVVATTAFGMGIDLPDIRQVIHHHLPGSIEAYYQEAGRAGRDGEPAECVLLWSPADRDLHAYFAENPPKPTQIREGIYARLAQSLGYARLRTCRHARIGDYFGEPGVPRTCSACDNCLNPGRRREESVAGEDLRRMLAALRRFSDRLGAEKIAAIVAGQETSWVRSQPWLTELEFFGSLRWPPARLRELLTEMVEVGLARQTSGEYPRLAITELGSRVLNGETTVALSLPAATPTAVRSASGSAAAAGLADQSPESAELLARLRTWRLGRARQASLPAYIVFSDRTLAEIAARRPRTAAELASVPGVGPAKLQLYAAEVLSLVG